VPAKKEEFDGNLSNYQPFENNYNSSNRDANNSCTVMVEDADDLMKTKESAKSTATKDMDFNATGSSMNVNDPDSPSKGP
jgi:hypothetical protein